MMRAVANRHFTNLTDKPWTLIRDLVLAFKSRTPRAPSRRKVVNATIDLTARLVESDHHTRIKISDQQY